MQERYKHNHTPEALAFFAQLESLQQKYQPIRECALSARRSARTRALSGSIGKPDYEVQFASYIALNKSTAALLQQLYPEPTAKGELSAKEVVLRATGVPEKNKTDFLRMLKGDNSDAALDSLHHIILGWGIAAAEAAALRDLYDKFRVSRAASLADTSLQAAAAANTPPPEQTGEVTDFRTIETLAGMLEWLRKDCHKTDTITCKRTAKLERNDPKDKEVTLGFLGARCKSDPGLYIKGFFNGDLPKPIELQRKVRLNQLERLLNALNAEPDEITHANDLFDRMCPPRQATSPTGHATRPDRPAGRG